MKLLLLWITLFCALPASAASTSPIIFIHGFKGSGLESPQGKKFWFTGWQATGLSAPTLALPLEWDGLTQRRDELRATEPLRRVDAIPYLLGEDVYGTWLDAGAKMGAKLGAPFVSFSYDWRRDNLETLAAFTAFVESTIKSSGAKQARIVGHSLGGLIAMALVKERPELVERAVFAGVPFGGGVGFLLDLHAGIPNGLNARILSPEVLFTFPSIYALFPDDGKGLVDAQGTAIPVDFFDADDWKRLGLGAIARPDHQPARLAHLSNALAQAKKFRARVSQKASRPLPPMLVVLSRNTRTLGAVTQGGTKSIAGWDFDSANRVMGDARVPAEAAVPAGVPHEVFETRARHAAILNDAATIEKIRAFFQTP